jgi:hypothetical protein
MNIVGIITIISMILGLIASKYLKGVIYPNPNRNYSKLNNLCMRLAPCDTWTYKGSMYTDIHWNKNVKRAEKSCNKTGEFTGDYEFRNKYKCFFDKTTDKDYPTCMDCATQVTNKITNEMECGKPGHDIDLEDIVQLPNLNECLNITGYSTSDKKCSTIELFNHYNIDVPKDTKLDDKWWDKNKALYDCIMGKDEYLNEKWDYEFDEENNPILKEKGKGINSIDRLNCCTFCGNITDNDDDFKDYFNTATNCYKTDYKSPECYSIGDLLDLYEQNKIK